MSMPICLICGAVLDEQEALASICDDCRDNNGGDLESLLGSLLAAVDEVPPP